eukprot:gene24359-29444_t
MATFSQQNSTEVVVKAEISTTLQNIDTSSWKAGQKFPTPSPGNGDRVFYESLLQQRPESEMAQEWCVSYGILPLAQHNKVYIQVCKRKGVKPVGITEGNEGEGGGSPVKKAGGSNRTSSPVKAARGK